MRRLVNRIPAAAVASSGVSQAPLSGISCSPLAIHPARTERAVSVIDPR